MPSTNARPKELSKRQVRKLFTYDADIGRLRWRREPSPGKNKVGEIAGGINIGSGYRQIVCNGQYYAEHRLIWIYHYGDIPADRTPDHINQIKDDNHLSNLRLLTDAEQMYAKPARGFLWSKKDKRWVARIRINYKSRHLGNHKSAILARLAYERGTVERHRTINHTQFTDGINALLAEGTPVSASVLVWLENK